MSGQPNAIACRWGTVCTRRNPRSGPTTARGSHLFLFIALMALPYLVDVAYCEDLTPSHSAQALLGDASEADPSETKAAIPLVGDQYALAGIQWAVLKKDVLCQAFQSRMVVVAQHLSLALLTSRPPPIFLLPWPFLH